MKKRFLAASLTLGSLFSGLFATQATQALPLADIHLKGYSWQTEYSGEIGDGDNIATFDELGFDEEDTNSLSVTLTHSVPIIPNFKFQQTSLDTKNTGTLTRTLEFNGDTLSANDDVTTTLDLSHFDITAFYSFFYFDIGLTGRNFDTESAIVSNTVSASATLDGWLPMAYVGVNADLPLTGLYIDANLNTISYDGNGLQDLSAAIGYNLGDIFPLTAELGYRKMSLELEDLDGIEGDFTIDGWFFSLGLAL